MKKRLIPVMTLVFIAGIAVAGDKKMPSLKLVRSEGKTEEFLLNPSAIATGATATWEKSSEKPANGGDDPVLEFTSPDSKTLEVEIDFDTLDSKDNVNDRFIRSLESLTLVDPALQRPPMVKATWSQNSLPAFSGVVESMSTKYTMFLPDGTPVRATATLKMKQASRVTTKKSTSGQ